MNTWSPITLDELQDAVLTSERRMDRRMTRLWKAVRIDFAKWQLHPWGDEGNGFWAVGLIGPFVLWYNDIECGFNWSHYSQAGIIDEYWCNQDELCHAICRLKSRLDGADPTPNAGPPQAIPDDDH